MPALHPDIPHVLDMGDKVTEQILANLALEAHAHGVALPGGKFTTIQKTLQAQWNTSIAAACGSQLPLSINLDFSVSPTALKVHISPTGHLAVLRMKPVVDALNKARKGLGWWVFEAASAATQDRYPIYRVQDAAEFLEYNYYAGAHFSDESFIEEYNQGSGGDEDLTREQMEEVGQFFWPSDLIKAVDGHTWLLARVEHDPVTHQRSLLGTKPYVATLNEVQKFLKGRAPKELKTIVADFLALLHELARPDSLMKDAVAPHHEDDEFGTERIGASCALVWNDEAMVLDLIQHHEVEMQEHGEYEEIHIEFKADPTNQVSVSRLVQSIKDFVTRHAAIGKAFSHFEVIK